MLTDNDPQQAQPDRLRHDKALANGAIAVIWRYDPSSCWQLRHNFLDGKAFFFRESWAISENLLNKDRIRIFDANEFPCTETWCGCDVRYLLELTEIDYFYLSDLGKHHFEVVSAHSRKRMTSTTTNLGQEGEQYGFSFAHTVTTAVERYLKFPKLSHKLDDLASPTDISEGKTS